MSKIMLFIFYSLDHTKQVDVGIVDSEVNRHKSGALGDPLALLQLSDNCLGLVFQVVQGFSVPCTTVAGYLSTIPGGFCRVTVLVCPPEKDWMLAGKPEVRKL